MTFIVETFKNPDELITPELPNKAELLKSIEEIQQLKNNNNQIFAKQIKI
jgi:hypothetical protein